jgi:hypothetical protein
MAAERRWAVEVDGFGLAATFASVDADSVAPLLERLSAPAFVFGVTDACPETESAGVPAESSRPCEGGSGSEASLVAATSLEEGAT